MLKVNNEDFVMAWIKSESHDEVAERLGVAVTQVYSKAQYLRKLGVNLPKYQVGPKAVDVDALNALIDSYAKKTTTEAQ